MSDQERKEKFTPGPWTSINNFVHDADGLTICVAEAKNRKIDDAIANAALIAAAPEMRDMLAFLLEFVENGGNEGEIRECYAPAIRDLLKKTRGEK